MLAVVAAASSMLLAVVAPSSAGAAGSGVDYVPVPVCAAPAEGHASCFAMRLTAVRSSRLHPAGAVRMHAAGADALPMGPKGGYTPADLAKAYGLNVNVAVSSSMVVGIVDAFSNPNILSDLNTFNAHYGIPAETSTSFKVVNQSGAVSPLPPANTGWGTEESLDVQSVRALCRKCKIVLVEGTSNAFADLAAATNTAATTMHAKVVSNSYGGAETASLPSTFAASYNHHGVVIAASTGDDGWYSWDKMNTGVPSVNAAQVPAALNTVVAVGGTSLYLNPSGTRASETVWNENGPHDRFGDVANQALGASGGGCSVNYNAQLWQRSVAGYSTLGCGTTKRSMGDIAAIADPFTGFDIFDTGSGGWATYGGTSLASPVIAAMWALAGGAGGIKYPALTLYGHYKSSNATYDVLVGGNGACSTSSTTTCSGYFGGNPNTIGLGRLDCAFAASGSATIAHRGQCYAGPGYDGPSGVGTPNGLATFKVMKPKAAIASPGTVTHNVTKKFDGSHSSDPFPGGTISKYSWKFGDGGTSTSSKPSHKYTHKGKTYTISLAVTDSYGLTGTTTRKVTIK